jgi:hypothetical protein
MSAWNKITDKRNDVVLCWVKLDSKGKLSCRCTSQLNHWERFMRKGRAARCGAIGCRSGHLSGAQVKKTEGSDEERYIVPLCLFHGKEVGECPVNDSMKVSARKQKTCR